MILIKTKYKIFIASLLQLPIVFFLKILKKPSQLFINRNGINWFADLNEGIDFSIFLTGKFEHENSNFFKKTICKNDIVFDIGANIGAHTLPIANYVGECGMVHAFEPTKYAYEKQKRKIGDYATAAAAVTPHFSSNCFESSAASTTVKLDKSSIILFKSAIIICLRLLF